MRKIDWLVLDAMCDALNFHVPYCYVRYPHV